MKLRLDSHVVASSLLALGLAACSPPGSQQSFTVADDAKAFAAPTRLTATLTDSASIDLMWEHNATEPGGYWVEFTTPGDDFVKLGAVWSHTTRFHHPDLASDTEHHYRVLPFFGRASEVIEITTGRAPSEDVRFSESEGPLEMQSLAALGLVPLRATDEPEPIPVETSSTTVGFTTPKKSVRANSTAAEAAPADLKTTLSLPVNVVLRWTDRAADEDGYLVEFSTDPEKDFQICALLPPDTMSFRKVMLPPETKCYFRVRAFFYGNPSNVAIATTAPELISQSASADLSPL